MGKFFDIIYRLTSDVFELFFPAKKSEGILSKISLPEFKEKTEAAENQNPETRSLFSYRNPLVKDLIWLIKYKKRDFAIRLAAELLLDETLENASEQMIFAGGKKIVLIPIPISGARLSERGYNQMNEVAKAMMKIGGEACFEYAADILIKNKNIKSQTSIKNRKERLQNVLGCFVVQNPERIRGRNVLVIDDVTTTGATLIEAGRLLRAAGVKNVELLAIAH